VCLNPFLTFVGMAASSQLGFRTAREALAGQRKREHFQALGFAQILQPNLRSVGAL